MSDPVGGPPTDPTALAARIDALRQDIADLEAQALALLASNAALEDFAYAATHDLQSPLRAMAHFATWIEEDLPLAAPDALRALASEVRIQVEAMSALQERLLAYARISGHRQAIERVMPAELVTTAWASLAPGPQFSLVVDAETDMVPLAAAPLRTVLSHLLANAVRHHDRPEGQVRVVLKVAGGWLTIEVTDDGPGLPADAGAHIFCPAPEGPGMGLAMARRHAEHACGHVDRVPGSGRGATFQVRWPLCDLG